jgi:hypothetical protein
VQTRRIPSKETKLPLASELVLEGWKGVIMNAVKTLTMNHTPAAPILMKFGKELLSGDGGVDTRL